MPEDVSPPELPGRRSRYALHLGGLACLAISQPVFSLLARNQEFLVAHRLTGAEIAILAGLLSWGLAAAVALPVLAADLAARGLGRVLYGGGVLTLVSAIVLHLLRGLPVPAFVLVTAALAAGSLVAFHGVPAGTPGLPRRATAGFLDLLATAALVVCPAVFLFTPPIAGLLFAGTGPTSAAPAPEVRSTTPVVLVIFDELPLASLLESERRIDAGSYPAFAELAGESHWFRNTTTVAYQTALAIPAIVTGRYPSRREPVSSAYPESLFTWLGTSYRMNVIETGTRLCPAEVCGEGPLGTTSVERLQTTLLDLAVVYPHLVLPPALRRDLPDVTSTWRDFLGRGGARAEEARRRSEGDVGWVFERFLASIEPPGEPTLSFLHVNLPHLPWKYFPSGREYGPLDRARPPGLVGLSWRDDAWAVDQGYQRYLLQLGYADRLLGRLLKKLRETGTYDPALVVVTADHGASFQPGRYRRVPDRHTASEIFFVPLFVKAPFQKEGRVTDRVVETIDVLPTIAEALGSPLPWKVDGRPLLTGPEGRRGRHVVGEVDGEPQRRPLREGYLDLLDTAAQRRLATFGDGVFEIGPFRELLGLEPGATVPVAPASSLVVEVEEPSAFEDVDLRGAYLPALVSGRVRPGAGSPRPFHLAVALNGVLRAVTRSYHQDGEERFSAMLPESSFVEGFNRLDVFEVLGGKARPVLAPVPVRSVLRYGLERRADGSVAAVALSDGRRFPVGAGDLQGEVRFLGAVFSGWAADVERGRRAELVLLFRDDELVARIAPRLVSPEAAVEEAGFKLVVPFGRIGRPEASRLVFVALLDGKAGILTYE